MDTGKKGPTLRKLYYSIGEVSELTGVPAHVLRYWEGEFQQLHPKKGRTGNRLFQERDIRIIEQIKKLLYEQRFTIAGAITQLENKSESNDEPTSDFLSEVRQELQEILDILDNHSGRGAAR